MVSPSGPLSVKNMLPPLSSSIAEGPLKGFASYSLTNSLSCPSSPCRNTAWCATSHTKTAPSTSTHSDEGEPAWSKAGKLVTVGTH